MVKFIESCVKLVTWNVHGLDNDMLNDDIFINCVENNDVVVLRKNRD